LTLGTLLPRSRCTRGITVLADDTGLEHELSAGLSVYEVSMLCDLHVRATIETEAIQLTAVHVVTLDAFRIVTSSK